MSGIDLSTKAGVLRFCELGRAEMVGCFERLGRFEMNGYSFGAYVFATHGIKVPATPDDRVDPSNWQTGGKLPRVAADLCRLPKVITDLIPPEQHTQLFAHVMRSYSRITKALGTLVMTEMWHANMTPADGQSPEEARAQLPDNLEHAPGRGEGLYMQLEHSATGRRVWWCEIKREPTRLGEWELREMEDAQGRLVNLADWQS